VVGQPEEAEGQHDGQDELLAANATPELGLPEPPQDADVADDDDGVRDQKAQHELQRVLEDHLRPESKGYVIF